jgi:O-antigen/teichoic acid export membrane protein
VSALTIREEIDAGDSVNCVGDTPPDKAPAATMARRLTASLGRTGNNLLSASGAELVGRGAGFIAMVLLARYLQPAGFGVYNTLLAWFALAIAIGNFGVDRLILRDLARDPDERERGIPTVLTLRIGASLLTGVTLVGVGIATAAVFPFFLLAVAVLLTNISSTLALTFYARERFGPPSAAAAITSIAMAALCLVGIATRQPLWFFVLAIVGAEAVRLVWLWRAIRRDGERIRPGFAGHYAAYVLRASLPFGLLAVFGAVYFRIDMVMLWLLAGEESAGYYASAYRVLEVLVVLPGLVVGVLLPRLARLLASDVSQARTIYLKVNRVLVWLGLLVACTGALLAFPLMETLYTARYSAAGLPFLWLMGAVLFLFLNVSNTSILLSGDNLKSIVVLTAAATAANVALNLVLIPRFAAAGAAAATAMSEVLLLVLLTAVVCRRLGIRAMEYLRELRPSLSSSELALLLDREKNLSPR